MLDKNNLAARFSNGDVIIGTDYDLDVFRMVKNNNDGLYEIICSIDRPSDPAYYPKDGERFALTVKLRITSSTRERSFGTRAWRMPIRKQ
jgi:hypothetical protein